MAPKQLALAALAAALLLLGTATAAPKSVAPIPAKEAVSVHGPFDSGDCQLCHAMEGGKPGPAQAVPGICFDCHEEYKAGVKGHKAKAGCTGCHSPHNSRKKKLLL